MRPTMPQEIRSLTETPEFRSEGKQLVAAGVAIRYGSISKNLGGFVERLMPGCTTKTIQERDILADFDHDKTKYLGRTSNGSLRLSNSDVELRYEIDLPDTAAGREAATFLERGDVKGTSFAMLPVQRPTWSKADNGMALRSLTEISLLRVSPVFTPAYDDTTAVLRSFADERGLPFAEVRDAAAQGVLVELLDPEYRSPRRTTHVGFRDADEDPSVLAQAVDAALDEATDLFATVDPESLPPAVAQGIALVIAAETTIDSLLDVIGAYDADDAEGDDSPDMGAAGDATGPMPGMLTV